LLKTTILSNTKLSNVPTNLIFKTDPVASITIMNIHARLTYGHLVHVFVAETISLGMHESSFIHETGSAYGFRVGSIGILGPWHVMKPDIRKIVYFVPTTPDSIGFYIFGKTLPVHHALPPPNIRVWCYEKLYRWLSVECFQPVTFSSPLFPYVQYSEEDSWQLYIGVWNWPKFILDVTAPSHRLPNY